MSSAIASETISAIRALPPQDRAPVLRSILKAAGPTIEQDVLRTEKSLISQRVPPTEALIQALSQALYSTEGMRVLRVLAVSGAREAARQGKIPLNKVKETAKHFEKDLSLADIDTDSLGFVSAVITAATAIITLAAQGIASAVRKAKARRRDLKARLTPLTPSDIQAIIQIVGPTYPTYAAAEPEIMRRIAEVRPGRTGYIIDDPRGINERRDLSTAFRQLRMALNAQMQAEQTKKKAIYGAVVAVGGAVIVGALAVALS